MRDPYATCRGCGLVHARPMSNPVFKPDAPDPHKDPIRLVRIGDAYWHAFGDLIIGFVGRVGWCIDGRRSKSSTAFRGE